MDFGGALRRKTPTAPGAAKSPGVAGGITSPKTIKWALESYGRRPEEIVAAGVPRDVVEGMLAGPAPADGSHVRRVADAIGCPLATLLLPEPPAETPLRDFGRPSCTVAVLSRATLKGVRRARYMQSVGRQLLAEHGMGVEPDIPQHATSDDPEMVAESLRDTLGLGMAGAYPDGMTERDLYASLRDRIESLNIFTVKGMIDWDQICGFVICDYPCILAVAALGTIAEIHTLLHLFGHALLRETGACPAFHGMGHRNADLLSGQERGSESESWCNAFAAHALLPRAKMKRRAVCDGMGNAELNNIMDECMVQSDVFYAHAARLGLMPPPGPREAVHNTISGKKYTRMVLDAHRDGRITRLEAIEHLEYGL